ncbi:UNVERIFIED_CONTAM: hypothetical protein K2H54_066415 [Gekko kuhli]
MVALDPLLSSPFLGSVPLHSTEESRILRVKVVAGIDLAKKDIFGASSSWNSVDWFVVNGPHVELTYVLWIVR